VESHGGSFPVIGRLGRIRPKTHRNGAVSQKLEPWEARFGLRYGYGRQERVIRSSQKSAEAAEREKPF